MAIEEVIKKRFAELEQLARDFQYHSQRGSTATYADHTQFQQWATSAMNLLEGVFGRNSPHCTNFAQFYKHAGTMAYPSNVQPLQGIVQAARSDYEGGYLFSLKSQVSGEIFGDFVVLAKRCLDEGNKDTAAVLAAAALEDALKAYADRNGLEVSEKSMQEVVNALKAKGLVGGAQKSLLDVMPRIRDYAMHANWEKIGAEDVRSVIGFVEQFLLTKFS